MPRHIPVLTVQERSIAQAYEKALLSLYAHGVRIRTQYDKPGDPLSIDATMDITILEPWTDPMIHKAFPGGIEDLREYVMELEGAKDHWVKHMNDPADTRWEYTYHGRLARYGTWTELREGQSVQCGPFDLNQIDFVVDKLSRQPHSRQAQMITWMPFLDTQCYDPPCLQSLWYRILEDDDGAWWLNCNIRFRSNDAWGASFMNLFGFVQFNRRLVADRIADRAGRPVELGRLNWHADSYHIYGKDIETAKQMLFDRADSMAFEDRVFNFHDPFIQEMYKAAEPAVIDKIHRQDERRAESQKASPAVQAPTQEASPHRKRTILIVDDVEPILYVFERFLRREGYETLTAMDGEEGLRLWEKTMPDLVISDIRMPKMDGYALAEAIRKRNPKQKILLMSGYTEDIERLERVKEHGHGFLAKPVDLNNTLAPTVAGMFSEKSAASG
jgi:thymidylate synthase